MLTRVTSGAVGHAAQTGGDADPLALLLGGENGLGAVAFPATLQAALAVGAATGQTSDAGEAGEEGIDVTDLLATDATGDDDGGEGGTTSLDAVLAAALALGAAVAVPPAPASDATTSASSGEPPPVEGLAIAVAALATTRVEVASTGPVIAGDVTTSTVKGAVEVATAVAEPLGDPAATPPAGTPATLATSESSDQGVVPTPPTPPTQSAQSATDTATATAIRSATATTTASVGSDVRPASPVTHADNGATTPEHHATREVTSAGETTPFSSAGSEEHGLDLGTPERHTAGPLVEKATHAAVSTAPAIAPADTSAPGPVAGSASAAASDAPAAPPSTSPAPTQPEIATTRTASAAHHPGAIEARWSERVTDALRLSGVRGGGEIRLQLEPEGLGHIDVRLHMHADGVRAVIVAEHESTRALLTSQQHVLQEAFDRSDLRLSGFSVDVGSGGGAATFGHERDGGANGGAPGAPTPVPAAVNVQDIDSNGASLASGRLSVRV